MAKIIFSLLLFFPSLLFAQAQVFPTHLTLTEEAPSSYLNLRNSSSENQSYKIELMFFKMQKDGSMKREPSAPNALTDVIKFSPKTISLTPNEKQVVRVMATSFDSLTDGEYYIHIHFLPSVNKSEDKESEVKKSSSFSLTAKIAVAVPIVVRKGTGTLTGEVKNFKATYDKQKDLNVNLSLTNNSKFFLYGDLDLIAVTDKGEVALDKVIGLSSYLPERTFTKKISAQDLAEKIKDDKIKKIKVTYKSNAESAAAFDLASETEISTASPVKAKKKSSKRQ
ncbi:hypothetical protein [Bdellovibrio bacteriovorus]|uniref:hypothetical protein n=1 Tax=Bdellovibrio bacteriovorus TaxID=959 RepID=UPI0035A87562